MGRRTIENLEQKILRLVIKVGAKKGAEHVSTLDLAKKLEISEGTIFVHFKNKQQLLDSAYKYTLAKSEYVFSEIEAFKYDGEEDIPKFYELWDKMIVNMIENPDYAKFFRSYLEAFGFDKFESKIKEEKSYTKLMKKFCAGKVNDEEARRMWNFTFNSSLNYGVKLIDKQREYSEKNQKFVFNLIYGSVFFNPFFK